MNKPTTNQPNKTKRKPAAYAALVATLLVAACTLLSCGGPSEEELAAQEADAKARAEAELQPDYTADKLYEIILRDLDASAESSTATFKATYDSQEEAEALMNQIGRDIDDIMNHRFLPGYMIEDLRYKVNPADYTFDLELTYTHSENYADYDAIKSGDKYTRALYSDTSLTNWLIECAKQHEPTAAAIFYVEDDGTVDLRHDLETAIDANATAEAPDEDTTAGTDAATDSSDTTSADNQTTTDQSAAEAESTDQTAAEPTDQTAAESADPTEAPASPDASNTTLPTATELSDIIEDKYYDSEYAIYYVEEYKHEVYAFDDAAIIYLNQTADEETTEDIIELDDMSDMEFVQLLIDRNVTWEDRITVHVSSDRNEEDISYLTEIAVTNDCYDIPSHPDMRYTTSYPGEYGKKILELYFSFVDDQDAIDGRRAVMDDAIDRAASTIRANLFEGYTNEEAYFEIADYIGGACEYDNHLASYVNNGVLFGPEEAYTASAYGALVEGKSICSGYSAAFKAICDVLELPAWIITGQVMNQWGNIENHAWICVPGSNGYAYIDPTFMDQDYGDNYFLFEDATFDERTLDERWVYPW